MAFFNLRVTRLLPLMTSIAMVALSFFPVTVNAASYTVTEESLWTFEILETETVYIYGNSNRACNESGTDPYLWLYDSSNNLVTQDDDGNHNYNDQCVSSKIVIALEPDTYTIRAGYCCSQRGLGTNPYGNGASYELIIQNYELSGSTTTTTTTTSTSTTTSTIIETTTTTEATTSTTSSTTTTTTTSSTTTTTSTTTTVPPTTTSSTGPPTTTTTTALPTTTSTTVLPSTTTTAAPVSSVAPAPPAESTISSPSPAVTTPPVTTTSTPPTTTTIVTTTTTLPPTTTTTTLAPTTTTSIPAPATTVVPTSTTFTTTTTVTPPPTTSTTVTTTTSIVGTTTSTTPPTTVPEKEVLIPPASKEEVSQAIVKVNRSDVKEVSNVLQSAAISEVPEEELVEFFEEVDFESFTQDESAEIMEVLTDADDEVKKAFEESVNIFEDENFNTYVPTGSAIDVGTRRVVVAAGAALAAAGASVPAASSGSRGARKT